MASILSNAAKQNLMIMGRTNITPTCQRISALRNINQDWVNHELPIRYMHLIKLLSMKKELHPVLQRVVADVGLLKGDIPDVKTLTARMIKTLEIIDSLKIDEQLLDQIYTLEISVQLLLDEWQAAEKNVPLVEHLDVVSVVHEVSFMKYG